MANFLFFELLFRLIFLLAVPSAAMLFPKSFLFYFIIFKNYFYLSIVGIQ